MTVNNDRVDQQRRLAAVVVTHDRLDQLKITVTRLLEAPEQALSALIVVNNASVDGTAEWLASLTDPRLTIIHLTENTGGAGGFETGMRHFAAQTDLDWVVVMDDDARPEPGTLEAFQNIDLNGWDAFAAGVFYPDGSICEMNRPSRNPFWHLPAFLRTLFGGGRSGFHLTDADYAATGICQIDVASFVGLYLSRETVAKAGLPDGRLFLYGDDVLYTLGLRHHGLRMGFAPALRFSHDCKTLGTGGPRVYRPLWKAYYNYRNGLMAYRVASGWLFWPVLLLVLPKWYRLGRHYGAQRPAFRRLLWLAIKDGLAGRVDRSRAEIEAFAESAESPQKVGLIPNR